MPPRTPSDRKRDSYPWCFMNSASSPACRAGPFYAISPLQLLAEHPPRPLNSPKSRPFPSPRPVTDDEIKNLSRLSNLQYLDLSANRITDAGLRHLRGLSRLTILGVFRTDVTQAGVDDFKRAMPSCSVIYISGSSGEGVRSEKSGEGKTGLEPRIGPPWGSDRNYFYSKTSGLTPPLVVCVRDEQTQPIVLEPAKCCCRTAN